MRILFFGLLLTILCFGQNTSTIKVMSSNFAFDLAGTVDTRPNTWGTAESYTHKITFTPPIGYRVVVHSITGDIVSWVRNESQGKYGVLYGFQQYVYNVGGWGECDLCDVTTMLYGQTGGTSKDVATRTFKKEFKTPVPLPTNALFVKGAAWLNDTNQPVHFEITFTVEYEFKEFNDVF